MLLNLTLLQLKLKLQLQNQMQVSKVSKIYDTLLCKLLIISAYIVVLCQNLFILDTNLSKKLDI